MEAAVGIIYSNVADCMLTELGIHHIYWRVAKDDGLYGITFSSLDGASWLSPSLGPSSEPSITIRCAFSW